MHIGVTASCHLRGDGNALLQDTALTAVGLLINSDQHGVSTDIQTQEILVCSIFHRPCHLHGIGGIYAVSTPLAVGGQIREFLGMVLRIRANVDLRLDGVLGNDHRAGGVIGRIVQVYRIGTIRGLHDDLALIRTCRHAAADGHCVDIRGTGRAGIRTG